jgi:DNA polymerase-3 subunit delta'
MFYGHIKQREYFTRIIENGKISTAYIFSGKAGIGKRIFALYLAKYFFCTNSLLFEDCSCYNCQNTLKYLNSNVVFLDENNLKIDVIRQINELAYLTTGDTHRFIIMDNAHKLTKQAANAFLKTLEEAPANIIFILITSKYMNILPTIRSRCIKIPFDRLSDNSLAKILTALGFIDQANDVIAAAAGSVSAAIKYITIAKTVSIKDYIENKKLEELAEIFENIIEKDALIDIMTLLILYLYDKYKINNNIKYLNLTEYVLDLINKLDFNVNIEMIKYLVFIKIAEVANGL